MEFNDYTQTHIIHSGGASVYMQNKRINWMVTNMLTLNKNLNDNSNFTREKKHVT